MTYIRFAAMIAGHVRALYLNTFAIDHVFWSQKRAWMGLLTGAVMAAIMLKMYKNRAANVAIIIDTVAVFAGSLWLVRSQATVGNVDYMKAMIPHHSIAILTSSRAHIKDPRARELADQIIEAQIREIGEMKALIAELQANPPPANGPDLEPGVATD